ncbi:MAG: DUF433 domain-containing protein [Acidobacteria bacterium]|nr:DUF433 domain-containing protein [Acidobacteriota bacterium]
MGGKPCLRGMRITVGAIVGLVAAGHSFDGRPPRAQARVTDDPGRQRGVLGHEDAGTGSQPGGRRRCSDGFSQLQ